ncbi:MAG TPA: chemotaxis protein CheA [Baekduia sp.]|nr:chemotaxis protein CheA [Baekduia sp.]
MDTSEYLPLFIAECRENLDELTNAVVKLEEDPGDRETIDATFRVAHSLKGMSATMGFTGMATLTHSMEDVLDLMRGRGNGLNRQTIDVLLACLDALSGAVEQIEQGAGEQLDPTVLTQRLGSLVRGEDPLVDTTGDTPTPAATEAVAPAAGPVAAEPVDGNLTVTLSAKTMMPSVRAFQVLTAIGDHGQLVASTPSVDDVDTFDGDVIVAQVLSEDPEALLLVLRRITDVVEVELTGDVAAPAPVPPALTVAPEPAPVAPDAAPDAPPPSLPRPRPAAKPTHANPTVRVDAERLDQLLHLMGELVVKRTHVEELASAFRDPELEQAFTDLTRTSQALQEMVMRIRMMPIEAVFLRFPRLVRDASQKLGKNVELELLGQDTELDRTVVDAIGDPLVHLIRNALDHGIEAPEERVAAGKPETAVLTIEAAHHGGSIVISVVDDGRGVDPAALVRRAVERGLISQTEADQLDPAGAVELLFTPGFSTSETVGDLSGRGVGMDAVRSRVRKLGGEITLRSTYGAGTTAQIRLPLTLAIMPALLVSVGGLVYGFQLQRVQRTMRYDESDLRTVAGKPVLLIEEEAVPLIMAADAFGHTAAAQATHVVIVNGADHLIAVGVSGLIGQRELVTRALPTTFADSEMLSGAAVLANGDIVLLADCDALTESRDLERGKAA